MSVLYVVTPNPFNLLKNGIENSHPFIKFAIKAV
jgi:hypothetical protein